MPQAMVWAKVADHHRAQNQRKSSETSIEKWMMKVPYTILRIVAESKTFISGLELNLYHPSFEKFENNNTKENQNASPQLEISLRSTS